eukprot:Lankesteria_metandrocarpae@DN2392_c0_g1_i1.p1
MVVTLTSTSLPSQNVAFTNLVYVSPRSFDELSSVAPREAFTRGRENILCDIKGYVWNVEAHAGVPQGKVAFGKMHRNCGRIKLDDMITVAPWSPPHPSIALVGLSVGSYPPKTAPPITITDEELDKDFKRLIAEQALTVNQVVTISAHNGQQDVIITLSVDSIETSSTKGEKSAGGRRGVVTERTEFVYTAIEDSSVTLKSKKVQQRALFTGDFNLEKWGIGGLDKEFSDIFRRAFASRIFPPHVVAEMGLHHVRGMLLYGPPGTGKTLIARQIGKALKSNEPKIVNGPEVLNKFVGESEANIRLLFADAEQEQKKKGDNSALHIIIFDEIDAICKSRGKSNTGSGVNDSVVNQLLSKIDGVEALNNILLIGMTNRMDMIDDALLRPGRLEVHLEISLPDTHGRVQILNIHTAKIREAGRLEPDVDINQLAAETKNYSGAEIEGLVRSAASYAFNRQVNMNNLSGPIDADSIKIQRHDFEKALIEVRPAYGVQETALKSTMPFGIIPFSEEFRSLQKSLLYLAREVVDNEKTSVMSALLHGDPGTGKTALACHIALGAQFPFTKIISPENFIGQTESSRIDSISKVFDDAYKSSLSLIILDDIESLVDYSPIGPRFSNPILQALNVLIKRRPAKEERRIFILGTTSQKEFFEHAGLLNRFTYSFEVPLVRPHDSLRTVLSYRHREKRDFPSDEMELACRSVVASVGIQRLLLVIETAAQMCKPGRIKCDKFLDCMRLAGIQ